MAELPIIQYSSDLKISFGSLDFTVGDNGVLGLNDYRSDSTVASPMARSPSPSNIIPALIPLGSEQEDSSFGYDSMSDRSFDEDTIGSTYTYPHTVNMVDIVDPATGNQDEDPDAEEEGNPAGGPQDQPVEGGRQDDNLPADELLVGHHRRPRGSHGSRNTRRLDLGPDLEVDGVKVYHTPQNNITGAKTLLDTLMVDAHYQTPTMQKAVAMLKAATTQDAAKSQSVTPSTLTTRSTLETTDAMRKNGVNEGWMPDEKTDGTTDEKTNGTTNGMIVRILLQETTATADIKMTIRIGAIMMAIDDVVMMRMSAHATVVAQLRPQTDKGDPAVRIWLTSLPEESVTSWGDLNRKLIESFQATCNRPGNHFDLTPIKQKGDEPLRNYIKRFYAKKTEIPNVPDQQIITAFLGGIRSDDLVREIGKGKEKRSDKPESSKKDKRRKPDNVVNTVDRFRKNPRTNQPSTDELLSGLCPWHPKGNHKAKDCYYLKGFAPAALKVAKDPPRRNNSNKDKTKDDDDKDDSGEFQEPRKEVNFIFGGPDAYTSKRRQKLELQEINSLEPATPQYMRWSEIPITFDRSDHPKHLPKPGRYPLVLAATMKEVKFNRVLIDGGSSLDLIFTRTLQELGLSINDLQPSFSPFHGIVPGKTSVPIGQITLPVTFGTRDNFRIERILFQVADFESAYHAIIGRPSCEMATKQLMLSDQKEIQKAVSIEEQTGTEVPTKKPTKDKIQTDDIQTKEISLDPKDPDKVTYAGVNLDEK
ncbi:hypothetical protein QOZ80_4BG0352370 [Eleusine coracana subsp. coracana]|nr:hypothetical protein QOZ80_4BG0352370 [Eleusine coracana subsp. coracana]